MARATLWLFDIDGTLVDTGGAGLAALGEAALRVFGDRGPRLDLRGATDSGILDGMFRHFGREANDGETTAFYESYLEHLERNLAGGTFAGRVLPGVVAMLDRVSSSGEVTMGLLTGNIEAGAWLKMRHFGLERYFSFGAFGCDHADRDRLGPVALERATVHAGRSFSAEEIVVVGDTPKDIACAAAIGARCLAVATGQVGIDGLTGAHRVLESLVDPSGWQDLLEA